MDNKKLPQQRELFCGFNGPKNSKCWSVYVGEVSNRPYAARNTNLSGRLISAPTLFFEDEQFGDEVIAHQNGDLGGYLHPYAREVEPGDKDQQNGLFHQ